MDKAEETCGSEHDFASFMPSEDSVESTQLCTAGQ